MKIYALAISAQKHNGCQISQTITAQCARCKSSNEAVGLGMSWAMENFPYKDGWTNHQVAYGEISIDFVRETLAMK
jgi:hypothetical protein